MFHTRGIMISNWEIKYKTRLLYIYSRGLSATISGLHDGLEYQLRYMVQRIRHSFQSQEIDNFLNYDRSKFVGRINKICPQFQKILNVASTKLILNIYHSSVRLLQISDWKCMSYHKTYFPLLDHFLYRFGQQISYPLYFLNELLLLATKEVLL